MTRANKAPGAGVGTRMPDIDAFLAKLEQAVSWAPDWAIGLVLAAAAAMAALLAFSVIERIVLRLVAQQKAFWVSFIPRARPVVRAALVLVAVNLVTQSDLFPRDLSIAAARVVWALVIVLAGWTVMVAVDIASAVHLRRYRIDVADNLLARKHLTQIKILKRVVNILIWVMTAAAALMTFDSVRQFGVSLFASAGAAGLVVGLAARPVLANLIAGLQLAITQPIRIDDALIVEGEFGKVEDIGGSFVVIRLWDLRRMVVPLSYFIEKPFQNLTRTDAALIGVVTFQLDYVTPVEAFRAKAKEVVAANRLWDKKAFIVQVTDFKDEVVELRVLLSAANADALFDLRCEVREALLVYLQEEHPEAFHLRRQFALSGPQRSLRELPARELTGGERG